MKLLNNYTYIVFLYIFIIFLIYPFNFFNPVDPHFQGYFSRTLNLLGESFYMKESFSFPFFFIKDFSFPPGTSLTFTDSLPLFGFISKIISKIFNLKFWYSPIYQFISLFLNGYISFLIIYRITNNYVYSIIGGIFFLLIPFHIERFDRFPSLTSHFIFFLPFYFYILKLKKIYIYNSILIFISIGTHFYIACMTCIVIIFLDFLNYNKFKYHYYFYYFFTVLLSLFFFDYFLTSNPGAFNNFGTFSTNLISLINPLEYSLSHKIFGNFEIMPGQYEGNAWLGMGGFFIMLFSLFIFFLTKYPKKKFPLLFILLVCLFSLSNKIYLSNILFFEFNLNTNLNYILNIWQSSGRFIWLIGYLILFFGILQIFIFYNNKYILFFKTYHFSLSNLIIIFLTILQFIDSYYLIKNKFSNFNSIDVISNGLERDLKKFKVDHFHANYWDPQIAYSAYMLDKSTSIRYNSRPLKNEHLNVFPKNKKYIEFIGQLPNKNNFKKDLCTFNYDKDNFLRNILYVKNEFFHNKDFCFNYEYLSYSKNMFDNIEIFLKNNLVILITEKNNLNFEDSNFNNYYLGNFKIISNLKFYNDNNDSLNSKIINCNSEFNIIKKNDEYMTTFQNIDTSPSINMWKNKDFIQLYLINENCNKFKNYTFYD